MLNPEVGLGLGVMSPRVAEGAWSPRVFGNAAVAGAFGPHRDVAREGTIEDLSVDFGLINPDDDDVLGQGSRTRAELENLVMHAGVGLAWPVQAFGRDLHLRFSLEYVWQTMDVEGTVRRAVCNVDNGSGGCGAISENNGGGGINDFREIDLRSDKDLSLHGLGPGFELEVDAARIGSVLPTVSIGVQAYRFLGDRDVKFYTRNEYDETARFTFEQKPWAVRAGVGVRFRWIPE